MSNQDIIRAWKDEEYRQSLSEAERALLPEHPAGLIELEGAEIDDVGGGHTYYPPDYSADYCESAFRTNG
jgi:mersacidin/lichenicidin family type 2 lantibiotic